MGRRRDHRVRMDVSYCPDPDGCKRLYHGVLGGQIEGDCCECCGQVVVAEDCEDPTTAINPHARCAQCSTCTSELTEHPEHGLLCPQCAHRQAEHDEPGHGLSASTFGFLSEEE